MSKPNLVKRIEKLESPTFLPRWKACVFDESLKMYSGQDIGGTLTPAQFKAWYAKQDKDTQVIIVRVVENKPKLKLFNGIEKFFLCLEHREQETYSGERLRST